MLEIGSTAKDFSLKDQDDVLQSLKEYRGKWVVLYFYPKDDTPGCTLEACGLRDNWQEFMALGVEVFGISADSVESHKKFAVKYKLPFKLLSDSEKQTLEEYQVWLEKSMFGKKYMGIQRATYIIDPSGKIAQVFAKVTPTSHTSKLLKELKKLMKD